MARLDGKASFHDRQCARGVRFTAQYNLLLSPQTLASIWPMQRTLPTLGLLAFLRWLTAWVVVDGAGSENLTELIARVGSIWLSALTALFAPHVPLTSGPLSARPGWALGVITLVMLPVS